MTFFHSCGILYSKGNGAKSSWIYGDKKMIGDIVCVTVDRPLGSYHPKHKDIYYPINYGYIEGIIAPDGEEQDAYILGVDQPVERFTGKIIAIVHRYDDVEEKWVVCPENASFTKEEIIELIRFQEQYFQSEIIM
jgi:inorganic pyrophosphatase